MDIEWSEPPKRQGGKMNEFVAELRKNPGQWGRYPFKFKAYSNITMYRTKYPDIEFRPARTGKDEVSVWGRTKEVTDD